MWSFWNVLDVAYIGLFAYKLVLFWRHVSDVNPALDDMRQLPTDVYYETQWIAVHQRLEDLITGILILASWIKVRCCYHVVVK